LRLLSRIQGRSSLREQSKLLLRYDNERVILGLAFGVYGV
jgi:hypothetical protein